MADTQNNDSGTNTVLIVLVLLILVALAVWLMGGFNLLTTPQDNSNIRVDVNLPKQNPPPTPTPEPTPKPIPEPILNEIPAPKAVTISDLTYSPATLTVKRGTKVTWTNSDTTNHNIVSTSGNVLNSPTLSTGQSFSYTFQNTGTFAYKSTLHPNVFGSVIVID